MLCFTNEIQKYVQFIDCKSEFDFAVQTDYFPSELIMLARNLNLGISLTQYHCENSSK